MDVKPRGDVTRLPQWAQGHILALNRRIESLESQLASINSGNPSAYWTYGIDDTKHGIPEHATVTFVTQGGDLDLHLDGKYDLLHILGDRVVIVITPGSSNAVYIRLAHNR